MVKISKKHGLIIKCGSENPIRFVKYPNNSQHEDDLQSRPYEINLSILNFVSEELQHLDKDFNLFETILNIALEEPFLSVNNLANKIRREQLASDIYDRIITKVIESFTLRGFESYPGLKNLFIEGGDSQYSFIPSIAVKIMSGIKYIIRHVNSHVGCLKNANPDVKYRNLPSRQWNNKVWNKKTNRLEYVLPVNETTLEEIVLPNEKALEDLNGSGGNYKARAEKKVFTTKKELGSLKSDLWAIEKKKKEKETFDFENRPSKPNYNEPDPNKKTRTKRWMMPFVREERKKKKKEDKEAKKEYRKHLKKNLKL